MIDKILAELKQVVDVWRECADSHHYQTYNKGLGQGLTACADTIDVLIERHQDIQPKTITVDSDMETATFHLETGERLSVEFQGNRVEVSLTGGSHILMMRPVSSNRAVLIPASEKVREDIFKPH